MHILLTGSSGWLGRFLAPKLQEKGCRVTGLDVAPAPQPDIIGSVADRQLVDQVFRDYPIDAVIHAGALHKPSIARCPAQAFVDVNLTGRLHLLEAAAEAAHDRLIFTPTAPLITPDTEPAEQACGATDALLQH